MKILKLPYETIIKCDCGCEFEFEYNDIVIKHVFKEEDELAFTMTYVYCPFCRKAHDIRQLSKRSDL